MFCLICRVLSHTEFLFYFSVTSKKRVTNVFVCFRYWRPGPAPWGSLSYYNYRYILFGFVYLQDLVDRSIIEIVTNKPVEEPGLYMQQFPYPCYIQDK